MFLGIKTDWAQVNKNKGIFNRHAQWSINAYQSCTRNISLMCVHKTKRWACLITVQKKLHTPRHPHCPAAHRDVFLLDQGRRVCLDSVKTAGGGKRGDSPEEWQIHPMVVITGIRRWDGWNHGVKEGEKQRKERENKIDEDEGQTDQEARIWLVDRVGVKTTQNRPVFASFTVVCRSYITA